MYSSLGLLYEFVFLYLGDEVEENLKKINIYISFLVILGWYFKFY